MSETNAIARLLADPEPGVAQVLQQKLAARAEDPPGLKEAIEQLEDPQDRARAREGRLEVGRERAVLALQRMVADEGVQPDLEAGALEIARLDDPDADLAAARNRLDELGGRLGAVLAGEPGTPGHPLLTVPPRPPGQRQKLLILAWFLGESEGFEGDREEYDAPRNSSLPEVLARKRGLPIALSVVYLLVARRAGVDLYGVGAPLHFIVGGPTETRPLFLDPFHKGKALEADEVADLLRRLDVAFRAEHLAPTPPRQILARMARNLVAYHARRTRGESRARRYARVALAMEEAP